MLPSNDEMRSRLCMERFTCNVYFKPWAVACLHLRLKHDISYYYNNVYNDASWGIYAWPAIVCSAWDLKPGPRGLETKQHMMRQTAFPKGLL